MSSFNTFSKSTSKKTPHVASAIRLITGSDTFYVDSRTTRYLDIFVVGGGGAGGSHAINASTDAPGGGAGGCGALELDLSGMLTYFSGNRIFNDIFTVTTSIGSGAAGGLNNGNAGGSTTISVKSNNFGYGTILEAQGGRGGVCATSSDPGGGGGSAGQTSSTTGEPAQHTSIEMDCIPVQVIPLLGNSLTMYYNMWGGIDDNLSHQGNVGLAGSLYITAPAGGSGTSPTVGGTHSGLQLPDWIRLAGLYTGTAGAGATGADAGGGAASFNGAGGQGLDVFDTPSAADATGYGGGGGGSHRYDGAGGGSNPAGDGAPGVAVIRTRGY